MAAIISSHNRKVLKPDTDTNTCSCNCRVKEQCPLNGNCLAEGVIYKATVSAVSKPTRQYFGLTEGKFKTRYSTHMHSFRAENAKTATELSKYVWSLKSENLDYDIKWNLVQKAAPYKCGTRRCDICLSEKMVIATANTLSTLNKRAEIVSTCRHRAKFRYAKLQKAHP